jgi:chain length determinant protein tyrosine kinase EpsG
MSMQTERSNVVAVAAKPSQSGNQIGALLIDAGKIIAQDAEQILRYAKEKGLRFGDAAVELGLVTSEEIQRVIARQFDYAYLIPGESLVSHEVVAAYAPFSRQVEAFRAIRSQLLLRWFGDDPGRRRLTVLSLDRGDGRSYTTANLAVVFSQLGEHTLLVDTNMRHPRQHQIFGLANAVGLSTMLSGRAGPEAIQRVPTFVALSVLPAGPLPPNPQELLNRTTFGQLLDEWGKQFDVVLIDTCAVSVAADAQVVAAKAKGALILTRVHKTRVSQVRTLCEELASTGVSLVGSVVNR